MGRDFLSRNQLGITWGPEGTLQLRDEQDSSIQTAEEMISPTVKLAAKTVILPRSLVLVTVSTMLPRCKDKGTTNIDKFRSTGCKITTGNSIRALPKGPIRRNHDNTRRYFWSEYRGTLGTWGSGGGSPEGNEKGFITSPADIDPREPIKLRDAEVTPEHRKAFQDLCSEFEVIFSRDSVDLGKTPLLKMDIPTGDNPPITQRPYTLALKHVQWVQEEIEVLEKAGVIAKSVSPWASPIVIVPKKTAPGEPPRRRMCVDYRMLNQLLPKVDKAYSKAKGVLTLVPLPKIDEIYAKLEGSTIYSTFDMRSGYYHLELNEESQPNFPYW